MHSFRDSLNLVSKITPAKLVNCWKVLSSYYYSRLTQKPQIKGLPISISIEPTTSCNLRCPECPSGLRSFTRQTGMLDQELYKKIIDELSDTLLYLIFYFQGEPYLHKGFLDMVAYASEKKIYTATSTNAHYLDDENAKQTVESGLDRLIISIDGTTQETYESYRIGGSIDKVLKGTRNVIKWKRKLRSSLPYVIFQFLVVKPNEHQVNEVQNIAKDIGVDEVLFKTAQIYDFENGSDLIPDNPKYSRYKLNKNGKYQIKNPLLNHCWKMWHGCVITWDGKVVPCCFDKDASYEMGNVRDTPFQEVWQNKTYDSFRSSLLKSREEIDICKNCTEGTKVWA